MPAQTLAQARAKNAWETVERMVQTRAMEQEADHGKKLPMRIRAAGLAQALAYLHGKKQAPELRRALSAWVLVRLGQPAGTDGDGLMKYVIREHSGELRRATAESLAWLEWFVRFSDPHRKGENGNG